MEEVLEPIFWEANEIYVGGRLTCSNSTPWHRLDRRLTKRDHTKKKKKFQFPGVKPNKVLLSFCRVAFFRFEF